MNFVWLLMSNSELLRIKNKQKTTYKKQKTASSYKIISWKPLIFENRKKDRYKCLQSRFWIFIHFSLPLLHIYTFLRMNKTWKNKKRTCFEKLIERLIEKLFERLIERLLKAY